MLFTFYILRFKNRGHFYLYQRKIIEYVIRNLDTSIVIRNLDTSTRNPPLCGLQKIIKIWLSILFLYLKYTYKYPISILLSSFPSIVAVGLVNLQTNVIIYTKKIIICIPGSRRIRKWKIGRKQTISNIQITFPSIYNVIAANGFCFVA